MGHFVLVCLAGAIGTGARYAIAMGVFLTGTAAEITPVREIDGRRIGTGSPGPVTKDLQKTFFEIVRGEDRTHSAWLTRV